MLLKKLIPFLLLLPFTKLYSQKNQLPDSLRQLVIAARYDDGFIFAHNVHVQNTKGVRPNGFEIEYSHLQTDSATVSKFKCYPHTGFAFDYIDFNSELLGKSYSVSYFLEPNYRLGNNLKMNVRVAAGFSYLTNPHDVVKNPDNQSYSGHINTFLQLGLGLSYPVSKNISVYAMGNFFHNSNGGFKLPNSGVNYINASLGLQYFTYSSRFPQYKKYKDFSWKQKPFHFDASIYYSPKGGYNKDSTSHRKFVVGVSAQIVKQVSNIDALTATAEIYYDDGLRTIKHVYVHDSSSNFLAGLLIGHQFLLNRFTFSQQFGVYIFKQTKMYNENYQNLFHPFYQRWGISYNIKKRWSIGISLLSHAQIADYIDGRGIYRF
ncbi:MAG: acyloxyacyl hydrolase [Parafilimonas sp.]